MDLVKEHLLDRLALAREAHRLAVLRARLLQVYDPPEVTAVPVLVLLDQLWDYERNGTVPAQV